MLLLLLSLLLSIRIAAAIFFLLPSASLYKTLFAGILVQTLYDIYNSIAYVIDYSCHSFPLWMPPVSLLAQLADRVFILSGFFIHRHRLLWTTRLASGFRYTIKKKELRPFFTSRLSWLCSFNKHGKPGGASFFVPAFDRAAFLAYNIGEIPLIG